MSRSRSPLPFGQLDLFGHVAEAYAAAPDGVLDNATLYARVAESAGIDHAVASARRPIGITQQMHSPVHRAVRWVQQTLKHMQVLRKVSNERAVWQLCEPVSRRGLHRARDGVKLVAFSTHLGMAIWGSCETVFAGLDQPITLTICSPPYPIARARAYGKVDESEYTDFICRALEPIVNHLAPGGSVCINVGQDVFVTGSPERSLVTERLTIALAARLGLKKLDTLIWFNPSRPPGPVAYASKTRVHLNAGYEPILWLSNDPTKVKSDNRRVLMEHSRRHLALIQGGGEQRTGRFADGAYAIRKGSFGKPTAGRIPQNVIVAGHRCAESDRYRAAARELGLPVHGAMFPLAIPEFLIRFLSDVGEIVVDPFGGSVRTGRAAENLGRRWIVAEHMLDYLRGAAPTFADAPGYQIHDAIHQWRGSARLPSPISQPA